MKKIFVLLLSSICFGNAMAQKGNIQSALNYLKDNDMPNAKKMIDEASENEKTKNDSKTWLYKGAIYQTIVDNEKSKSLAPNGHEVALECYKKYMSLEPKYKKEDVEGSLQNLIIANFNDGINAYNTQKYDDAIKSFSTVNEIAKIDGGKIFGSNKTIDTISANSTLYKANSYFYANKYAEATPILETCADNAITKDAEVFIKLAVAYQSLEQNDKWIAAVQKGKSLYPAKKEFLNDEINYYLITNQQDKLLVKLEEATQKDPTNADLFFNLGATYDNIANPRDSKTLKDLPKPKEYTTYLDKAAAAYNSAIKLDPNKGDYNYNIGALYFNQAAEVNKQIVGTNIDQKKYDLVSKQRNEIFKKGIPYLEKAITIFETGGVKDVDKQNYKNSLIALKAIYTNLKQEDKYQIIAKKYEAFK